MAKKKNINKSLLTSFYMDYTLEHNEKPKTMFQLAKAYNFEEQLAYSFFGSVEAIERYVFVLFLENTIELLEKSDEYKHFDSRNKLLSFYFTFFENLSANRSYVSFALKFYSKSLKNLSQLQDLRIHFKKFIKTLNISPLEIKNENFETVQTTTISEGAWFQLLLTLKFWLDDQSPSFEKTDIFIEKAVNTTFDLLDTKPLKSIIDFGKFLFKEKVKFSL